MRLDRFLCDRKLGTRSQVKALLRQGLVTVNGETVSSGDRKIRENVDRVAFQGRELEASGFVYYMLNKPGGVVSASRDCQTR